MPPSHLCPIAIMFIVIAVQRNKVEDNNCSREDNAPNRRTNERTVVMMISCKLFFCYFSWLMVDATLSFPVSNIVSYRDSPEMGA